MVIQWVSMIILLQLHQYTIYAMLWQLSLLKLPALLAPAPTCSHLAMAAACRFPAAAACQPAQHCRVQHPARFCGATAVRQRRAMAQGAGARASPPSRVASARSSSTSSSEVEPASQAAGANLVAQPTAMLRRLAATLLAYKSMLLLLVCLHAGSCIQERAAGEHPPASHAKGGCCCWPPWPLQDGASAQTLEEAGLSAKQEALFLELK